jgi:hypothetical protein
MKQKFTFCGLLGIALVLFSSPLLHAQNVGIGIVTPLEKLHVAGNLRVNGLAGAGTRIVGADANGTLVIVAAGTNGQVLTQTAAGPVFQTNSGWLITGNAGTNGGSTVAAGTNFIGTTDNQNLDFRTNNTYRGRVSNLGEFFIGTLNTVLTGDLMNGVGNATFPWAVNGYSAFDGAGTYGQVTAGTTIFAGVQGEYNGTHAQGAGVRGLSVNTTAGTGFNAPHTGVSGNATTSGTYKYGVFGSGGTTTRSGGVMGYDYGLAIGALGYYGSSTVDYSVYGFGIGYTTGAAAGRLSGQEPLVVGMDQPNTNIGLGIYGGVMGGWVKGMKYGMHVSGERTSLYVDGSTFTNQPIAQLVATDNGNRVSTYVPSSTTADVYMRGKSHMANGEIYIHFDETFHQIISDPQSVTITVTPTGNSNGVYVSSIDENGFWVKENNNGTSNVDLSWIAVGVRKGSEKMTVSPEILEAEFDYKMRGVMHNDNSPEEAGAVWWDGTEVRFDAPPAKTPSEEWRKLARPGVASDK